MHAIQWTGDGGKAEGTLFLVALIRQLCMVGRYCERNRNERDGGKGKKMDRECDDFGILLVLYY